MKMKTLGSHGPTVSALGLGTMGMSDMYGPADRAESIATIHEALDQGITLLDTGDFYGMGHNEMLIAEALTPGEEKSRPAQRQIRRAARTRSGRIQRLRLAAGCCTQFRGVLAQATACRLH